jgi:CBS domain-containing protein
MQVKEVMTRNVQCVNPDASLQETACKMKDLDVGVLPVCDRDRLAGLLTDRDIAVRAVAEGRDPKTAKVCDAMTPGVDYCFEEDDVQEAARPVRQDPGGSFPPRRRRTLASRASGGRQPPVAREQGADAPRSPVCVFRPGEWAVARRVRMW